MGGEAGFILPLNRSDVNQILAVSDIFVSLSPFENVWSNTILEAMQMQVPCILTDAGYTKEVFTHGKDCYLIHPRDPEKLAEAIINMLEDLELRKSLAEQACLLLQKHGRSNSKIIAKHMDIYRSAVNSK